MKVTGAAAIIFLMLPVCSCTTTVGKERAAELQKPRPEILLKGRMPSLRSPHDLGGLLAYMRDGSEEERRRGRPISTGACLILSSTLETPSRSVA